MSRPTPDLEALAMSGAVLLDPKREMPTPEQVQELADELLGPKPNVEKRGPTLPVQRRRSKTRRDRSRARRRRGGKR